MKLEDYVAQDALGLAALIAEGEVTPQEAAGAAQRLVELHNPSINAVLDVLPSEEAGMGGLPSKDGPFFGVPFLIKEILLHAKGVRCEMGSRLARGIVPEADTELMARFRRAGLHLIGTTQTPEFGYSATTETVAFGPVKNPWHSAHSAGGSSGGSAAAVAAGIVPLAHANDGGGSIRIPASCCGLVGLKPTRDRIPSGPDYADPLFGLGIEFAVARSVADAAALLDVVAGADVGAPGQPVPPACSYTTALTLPRKPMRIAWSDRSPAGDPVDEACREAVRITVAHLESLGHILVEDAPQFSWEAFITATHTLWVSFLAAAIDDVATATGRAISLDHLEAVTLACYEDGKRRTAVDVVQACAAGNLVSRSVGGFFTGYDAYLTPTLVGPPARLGVIDQNRPGMTGMDWTRQTFSYAPFTPLFNTTGQPAMSVPIHWSADGLPIGVQLVGRFGDETTLFSLAAQLEAVAPWRERQVSRMLALIQSNRLAR